VAPAQKREYCRGPRGGASDDLRVAGRESCDGIFVPPSHPYGELRLPGAPIIDTRMHRDFLAIPVLFHGMTGQ
jgi:hypothetical protein